MNWRWLGIFGLGAMLASMLPAYAQERVPSPFFDCPYVNYFDRDCPQLRELWKEQERRRLQGQGNPSATPLGREPEQPDEQTERDTEKRHDLDADDTYLLFPKESLAPDAPPLFRLLLAVPTLDNARRYVRWYARRAARLRAVQVLIQRAGNELEAEAGGETQ